MESSVYHRFSLPPISPSIPFAHRMLSAEWDGNGINSLYSSNSRRYGSGMDLLQRTKLPAAAGHLFHRPSVTVRVRESPICLLFHFLSPSFLFCDCSTGLSKPAPIDIVKKILIGCACVSRGKIDQKVQQMRKWMSAGHIEESLFRSARSSVSLSLAKAHERVVTPPFIGPLMKAAARPSG